MSEESLSWRLRPLWLAIIVLLMALPSAAVAQ